MKSFRAIGKSLIGCAGLSVLLLLFVLLALSSVVARADDQPLRLQDLIDECLKNSPELRAFEARVEAAKFRIPQAKSLPDPMFMFGYQNEGFQKFTLGSEIGAMGMFGLSQMFFFPGKRDLKAEMATRDAQGLADLYNAAKLRLAARIKELYYDLFLAYKTINILEERTDLFSKVEDAAVARYSSGMGSQQEVVMAQTEKYMLMEKEEMQRQKIEAVQGMLNTTMGRDVKHGLGRPVEAARTPLQLTLDESLSLAKEYSPEVKAKQKMVQGAQVKVKLARKDYYPDVTVAANYFYRTGPFLDMWNLTASIPLPIYQKTKQDQAVLEAEASLSEAKQELQATEYMLSSAIRDSYSMAKSADRLMGLYREGLIPKAQQDVQLALSGYVAGKTEAITVTTRLKALLDVDLLYWVQYVEREKAIARLEALTTTINASAEGTK